MDYKSSGITGARGEHLSFATCLGCGALMLSEDTELHNTWHEKQEGLSRAELVRKHQETNRQILAQTARRTPPIRRIPIQAVEGDEYFWFYDKILKKTGHIAEETALALSEHESMGRFIVFTMTHDEIMSRRPAGKE